MCEHCQHDLKDHTSEALPTGAGPRRAGCVKAIGIARCPCDHVPERAG